MNENKLNIYIKKTGDASVPSLGQELTPVQSAKDQGVMRDSNLTFNEHVSSLQPSLLSTLYQINRVRYFFFQRCIAHNHNLIVQLVQLFKRSDTHSYNTRNKDLLSFPMCRTSASERGFYFRALNNLPVAKRNWHSVSQFKESVKRKMLRTKHEFWLDLVIIVSYTYLNVNKLFVLCLVIKM